MTDFFVQSLRGGPMTRGVYAIICNPTRRRYVGSSLYIPARWSRHRRDLKAGTHHAIQLQRAWNKYGADAFSWTVVETCSKASLLRREQHHLDQCFTTKRQLNSYPSAGSAFGWKQSPQAVAKRLAAMAGYKHSKETIARITYTKRLNRKSRLTKKQIKAIRRRYALGESQTVLGKKFCISQSYISLLVNDKRWKEP